VGVPSAVVLGFVLHVKGKVYYITHNLLVFIVIETCHALQINLANACLEIGSLVGDCFCIHGASDIFWCHYHQN